MTRLFPARSSGAGAAGEAPPQADQAHFWVRTAPIWHVVFGGGIVVAAAAVLYDEQSSFGGEALALVLLAALCAWYAATGARALRGASDRLGHLYLLGALPLFALMVNAHGGVAYLMSVLIAQVYIFIDRLRYASLAAFTLFGTLAATLLLRVPNLREEPWELLLGLGLGALSSVLIGLWIGGIIRQSVSRSKLIAQLREAQAALAAEREAAGAITERARLATEIHDTLAQGFTSILMLTQAAETAIDRNPAAVREQLGMIERTARENLAEARSMVAALTPAALQDATLPEAVRRLAARHRDETGVAVRVCVVGEPLTDADHDVVLLRVAQEALANVRRHAGAQAVRLDLVYAPSGTALTVHDDGPGFDVEAAEQSGGYGLRGMRHRVEQSGGDMRLVSTPDAGTTLRVVLP